MGPNFDSWYQKLNFFLKHKQILYVLTNPVPKEHAPNAHGAVRDTYLKWLNDRIMVHCIMRAVMNDEFNCKFKEALLEDMLKVLNESFGTPDDVERHKINCAIFNVWMREEASVIDHVLYMIEQIERLSELDCFLHE